MRNLRALIAAAAISLPATLSAQSGAAFSVSPGSRIRVTAPAVSSEPLYGHLVVLDGDSLVMVTPSPPRSLRIDLATVNQVQVSAGHARLQWAGVGAIVGGLVGLIAGAAAGGHADNTDGLGASIGGIVGGVGGIPIGAIVGAFVAPERWRTAWTPQH
jgi:hypothetical protein